MKVLFGILLPTFISSQLQVNRDSQSSISFANFHKINSCLLNATALTSEKVDDFFQCAVMCLDHSKCVSLNYGVSDGTNCKLFGVDRFASGASLVRNVKDFDHYYIERVCDDNPCANNGKCITYDEKNNFTCQCSGIYIGKTCTVPCASALGMENGQIQDNQLSMSSHYNNDAQYGQKNGRLNKNTWPYGAQSLRDAVNPWFKIDLQQIKYISAVGIQGYGASDGGSYTKTFSVSISLDGTTWKMYQEIPGTDKVFAGNTDVKTEVRGYFKSSIRARAVKVIAVTCENVCTFRLELYGC